MALLRGSLNEVGIDLVIACDPTRVVLWVGDLEIAELPVICRIQKVCIMTHMNGGMLAIPFDDDATWEPLRLRFALGDGSAFWSPGTAGGVSASALVAAGEVSVIPGGKTKLQLGQTRKRAIYTVVGVPGNATGQVQSGFEQENAGLQIDAVVKRVVGGVVMDGRIESSSFTGDSSKDEKSLEGHMMVRLGEWQPLVIFGQLSAAFPIRIGAAGLTVWVRVDYAY